MQPLKGVYTTQLEIQRAIKFAPDWVNFEVSLLAFGPTLLAQLYLYVVQDKIQNYSALVSSFILNGVIKKNKEC